MGQGVGRGWVCLSIGQISELGGAREVSEVVFRGRFLERTFEWCRGLGVFSVCSRCVMGIFWVEEQQVRGFQEDFFGDGFGGTRREIGRFRVEGRVGQAGFGFWFIFFFGVQVFNFRAFIALFSDRNMDVFFIFLRVYESKLGVVSFFRNWVNVV